MTMPAPDVGRLIERGQSIARVMREWGVDESKVDYDTELGRSWLVVHLTDALAALQARETATKQDYWNEVARADRAEAREATLRLERDSAREQFDKHVEWASGEVEALRQAQARLTDAVKAQMAYNYLENTPCNPGIQYAIFRRETVTKEVTRMPIVEDFPHIDPSVKHIGVSKLRGLNADKLRDTEETFVIQENDQPLAVLLTYEKYLAMQQKLHAIANVVNLLSDQTEVEAIGAAMADIKAHRIQSLDDITKELKKTRG